jgi:hypothetical protein
VEALQGDEVDGVSVAGDVFKTVGAEDEPVTGQAGLLTRLPGLIVGSDCCWHAETEADEAGEGGYVRERHGTFLENYRKVDGRDGSMSIVARLSYWLAVVEMAGA